MLYQDMPISIINSTKSSNILNDDQKIFHRKNSVTIAATETQYVNSEAIFKDLEADGKLT